MHPILVSALIATLCSPQDAAPSTPALDEVSAGRFRAAAEYSQEQGGIALLVRRGGAVVFEQYAAGFGAEQAFPLYSASHGFWAVAAVAAHEDGLFDLDGSAAPYLPTWQDVLARQDVLVHQLLDMTCGLDPNPRAMRIPATKDRYASAVSSRMVARPGERFRFSPSSWMVFGALLSEVGRERGEDSFAYLKRRVLAPAGIATREWERDKAGNTMIPYGAYLSAREWSKLGQLFLDGGRSGDEQIVSAEGLARCSRPCSVKPEYGMGFWLRGALASVQEDEAAEEVDGAEPPDAAGIFEGLPEDLFFSAGLGGQRLYVVPSLDLVVVRQGLPAGPWSDVHFLRLLLGLEVATHAPAQD